MEETYKNYLLRLPVDLVERLDGEATGERRTRPGQLEVILRERYGTNGQSEQKPQVSTRRKRAA